MQMGQRMTATVEPERAVGGAKGIGLGLQGCGHQFAGEGDGIEEWPVDEPPTESLQFEPGRLVLGIDEWDAQRLAEFRDQISPAGWQATSSGRQLTLTRADVRPGSPR